MRQVEQLFLAPVLSGSGCRRYRFLPLSINRLREDFVCFQLDSQFDEELQSMTETSFNFFFFCTKAGDASTSRVVGATEGPFPGLH